MILPSLKALASHARRRVFAVAKSEVAQEILEAPANVAVVLRKIDGLVESQIWLVILYLELV